MTQQPPVGQGLLVIDASLSHPDTSHSVGLLWTSDHPDAETSICTTYNIHKRQISMPPVEFETVIPASERPQTHALNHAATGIASHHTFHVYKKLRHPLTVVMKTLTLRLLMSYIYGAPSKARNANVVYIWTYVWQR